MDYHRTFSRLVGLFSLTLACIQLMAPINSGPSSSLFVKCDNWEYKLVRDILRDYDPSIRPSLHHNSTLNVTFGLALAQLIDVDERNMIITSNCWLNQGWIDHKLTWDPDMYDGIKFVHIPAEKIWKPDILLVNNADSWAKSSSISTNAIVKYNGNVTWLSTVIFKSSCSINVKYFPFDEQLCDMIFASWTFDGYFLDIDVNSNEGDVTNYIKNGEWHLVKLQATKYLRRYSCCEEPYPEIYYRLIIRRRPLFYVFNMVFPCLLITLVAFLGFYLPPGSGEKVSIGITTLLSITVFLMLVAESMPPTSEQLPLLGIYYGVTIGIVSLSTTMAVITLNVNNRGNKGREVPKFIRFLFFGVLAKIFMTDLLHKRKKRIEKIMLKSAQKISAAFNNQQDQQQQQNIYSAYSSNEHHQTTIFNNKIISVSSQSKSENNAEMNDQLLFKMKENLLKCSIDEENEYTKLNSQQQQLDNNNEINNNNNNNNNNENNSINKNENESSKSENSFNNNNNYNTASGIEKATPQQPSAGFHSTKNVAFDQALLSRPTSILKAMSSNDSASKLVSPSQSNRTDMFNSYSILYSPTPITPICQLHCMCECSNSTSFIDGGGCGRSTGGVSASQQIVSCNCSATNAANGASTNSKLTFNKRNHSFETNNNNSDWMLKCSDAGDESDLDEISTNILSSRNNSSKRKQNNHQNQQQQQQQQKPSPRKMSSNGHSNPNCRNKLIINSSKTNSLNNNKINLSLALPSNNSNNFAAASCSMDFMSELEKLLSNQFSPMIQNFMRIMEKNEKRVEEKERMELIQNEWSDVAMILDHMLCFIFPFMTVAICALIFLNSPHLFTQW